MSINPVQALAVLKRISLETGGASALPKNTEDQVAKATLWAERLQPWTYEQVVAAVEAHYRVNETQPSTHALSRRCKDEKQHQARLAARPVAREKHEPPTDLLDRSASCPICDARSQELCKPAMPFGINHVERNSVSVAKHGQHTEYEAKARSGPGTHTCRCGCGRSTATDLYVHSTIGEPHGAPANHDWSEARNADLPT